MFWSPDCEIYSWIEVISQRTHTHTFKDLNDSNKDVWSGFQAKRWLFSSLGIWYLCRLRYVVQPLYISAFPECEGRIRMRGNCSRYLTGFASLFHHSHSGGKCQVIMLLLESEWVRAAQSLKDAEAAQCLSELKALFRVWVLRLWLRLW